MKIKNRDIAKAAGVSVATVDRVLNERPGVHERTAALVKAVMEQMVAERIALPRRDVHASAKPRPPIAPQVILDVVLPTGTNVFIDLLADAFTREASLRIAEPIRVRIHRTDVFASANLAAELARVDEDSSGVIVVGLDHPVTREAIKGLDRRGISTVTLATDITSCPRIGYVGVDNRAAGRTAALLMGRLLHRPEGKIALIAGSRSFRGHEEREMGFRAVIGEEFSGLEIVGLREGHDEDVENVRLMHDFVASVPELVGVYSIGAGNRGIGQVLQEQGLAGKLVFIGHELTSETRALLLQGVMDVAIVQDPEQEAAAAINLLLAKLHDERVPSAHPIKIEVVLRENLP